MSYLRGMAFFPRPSSPSAVWADLRAFLKTRTRHQYAFAALSVALPFFILMLFALGSVEEEYRPPEVFWVKTFDPNRTDAEIRAQQKIDTAERLKREEKERAELEERRRPFKEQAEMLDKLGL